MTTLPTTGRRGRSRRDNRPDDAATTAFQHAPARAALDAWLLLQARPPESTGAMFAGLRDALVLLEQELLAGDDSLLDREVTIETEGCLDGEIRWVWVVEFKRVGGAA